MLKLKVPKMSCGYCAGVVERAVRSVDPNARISADLGSATLAVESDIDETAICEVIRSAGYENEKLVA